MPSALGDPSMGVRGGYGGNRRGRNPGQPVPYSSDRTAVGVRSSPNHERGCERQTEKNDGIVDMNLASPFDGIDALGKPVLSTDRTTVSDPEECQRIQQFLDGGGLVMMTGRKSLDLIDSNRGRVVPIHFRTDGVWIWPKGIGYYLLEYSVPVQTAFLQHIRDCDYVATVPDMPEIEQAINLLNETSRRAALDPPPNAP